MNKIYNNLTIDNLIKTEWFNQFNALQKGQILDGLEAGLDVPGFHWQQMREIKWGLEKKLDVSKYAKLEFSKSQMQEIRIGLEDNLDVSIYANPEFNLSQMDEIRIGLYHEVDVSIYAKPEIDYWEMKKIRMSLKKKKLTVFIYAKLIYFSSKIKLKLFKKSTL